MRQSAGWHGHFPHAAETSEIHAVTFITRLAVKDLIGIAGLPTTAGCNWACRLVRP
jgi:hypothetical protein